MTSQWHDKHLIFMAVTERMASSCALAQLWIIVITVSLSAHTELSISATTYATCKDSSVQYSSDAELPSPAVTMRLLTQIDWRHAYWK